MEFAAAVIVSTIVATIGFARRDRTVDGREASLCLTCTNAVVTHGTRGREWICLQLRRRDACSEVHGVLMYGIPCDFSLREARDHRRLRAGNAKCMGKSQSPRHTNIEQKGSWTQIVNSVGGED